MGKLVGSQEVQFTVEFADRFSIAAERRCDLGCRIGKISAGNLGKLFRHLRQADDLVRLETFAHEAADQIAGRCHFNAKATNGNGSLRQFRRAVAGTVSRKSQISGERAHGGAFLGRTSEGCNDRGKNHCNASKDRDRSRQRDHDVRPDLAELSRLLCENLKRSLTHCQAGNHVIDLIAEVGQLPRLETPDFNFLSVTLLSGVALPCATSSTAVRSSHATGCARGAFHSCGMDPFGLGRALRGSFLLVQRRHGRLHGSRDILGSRVCNANRIRIAEPVADVGLGDTGSTMLFSHQRPKFGFLLTGSLNVGRSIPTSISSGERVRRGEGCLFLRGLADLDTEVLDFTAQPISTSLGDIHALGHLDKGRIAAACSRLVGTDGFENAIQVAAEGRSLLDQLPLGNRQLEELFAVVAGCPRQGGHFAGDALDFGLGLVQRLAGVTDEEKLGFAPSFFKALEDLGKFILGPDCEVYDPFICRHHRLLLRISSNALAADLVDFGSTL